MERTLDFLNARDLVSAARAGRLFKRTAYGVAAALCKDVSRGTSYRALAVDTPESDPICFPTFVPANSLVGPLLTHSRVAAAAFSCSCAECGPECPCTSRNPETETPQEFKMFECGASCRCISTCSSAAAKQAECGSDTETADDAPRAKRHRKESFVAPDTFGHPDCSPSCRSSLRRHSLVMTP